MPPLAAWPQPGRLRRACGPALWPRLALPPSPLVGQGSRTSDRLRLDGAGGGGEPRFGPWAWPKPRDRNAPALAVVQFRFSAMSVRSLSSRLAVPPLDD